VEQAARTRFRPILMTAPATVVGILPIALGHGAAVRLAPAWASR
jgi:multidrug efflux pump subunit AcrB